MRYRGIRKDTPRTPQGRRHRNTSTRPREPHTTEEESRAQLAPASSHHNHPNSAGARGKVCAVPGHRNRPPRDAPPSRRAALVRAHPHTPDSSRRSSRHVRAHTSRRPRKHRQPSEGATCAPTPPGDGGATRRHGPACSAASLQTLRLGRRTTTPREGGLEEGVTGVLEARKPQPLTPPQT